MRTLHGLIKPIVSPPKLCGILIHFIVPRGTPRKIWWECAARFLKPLTIYDENLQFFLPYLWFKGKVCIWARWPIRLELIPVSIAWSNWEFFYSHPRLGGMLGPSQGYPPALSLPVPIYTPGWREALWEWSVTCPRTQQYTISPARAQTTRSGVECTNHEATTPPTILHDQTKISIPYLRT